MVPEPPIPKLAESQGAAIYWVDGGPTLSVLAKLHDDCFDIMAGEALKNAPVVTFLI